MTISPTAPPRLANAPRPQPRVRAWWRDSLEATAWMACVATTAFFFGSGALAWTVPVDALDAAGRYAGLIATVFLLIQVVLASRAPWVERLIGHDHALVAHARFGRAAFLLLLAHAVILTVTWGAPEGRDILQQTGYFLTQTRWIGLAALGLMLFVVVVLTSVAAVRRRWPYEVWHGIHLLTYAALVLSAFHQFTDGSTFYGGGPALWFWIALYVVAFGSLLVWRVAVPVAQTVLRRLHVESVVEHGDGTVSVTVGGAGARRVPALAGQFMLWRFWTPELWLVANPYSFSAAPDGRSLRITVRPSGDHSGALANLRPGTRVTATGPYGAFHHRSRTGRGLVLVGAGVGITPLRAMLEQAGPSTTVILRAPSEELAPLLEEVRALCHARGARLIEMYGPRGATWMPRGAHHRLRDLVPELEDADVYVCGPALWADAVIAEARESGVPATAVHREKYDW